MRFRRRWSGACRRRRRQRTVLTNLRRGCRRLRRAAVVHFLRSVRASLVAPEVLELVLLAPGAVDAAVGLLQGFQRAPVLSRALGGVMQGGPAACGPRRMPPLPAHLGRLLRALTTWNRSRTNSALGPCCRMATGVAAGPADAVKALNGLGLPCLALADPDDSRSYQPGDLVDAEGLQPADAVPRIGRCSWSDRVDGARPSRRAAAACVIHWQYLSSRYSKR